MSIFLVSAKLRMNWYQWNITVLESRIYLKEDNLGPTFSREIILTYLVWLCVMGHLCNLTLSPSLNLLQSVKQMKFSAILNGFRIEKNISCDIFIYSPGSCWNRGCLLWSWGSDICQVNNFPYTPDCHVPQSPTI